MRFVMIFAVVIIAMEVTVEAGPFRHYRQTPSVSTAPRTVPQQLQNQAFVGQAVPSGSTGQVVEDALAEVNAARAQRGLRPFLPDPSLTQAALNCAKIRAANRIEGHLSNDFAHVPAGTSASSAGCGAMEPSWGWGTCCTYENYTYAGAAWVMGADGKRYMHLFVR